MPDDAGFSNVPPSPMSIATPDDICALKVGGLDERGNTVRYVYACDIDYVVYYSRLEHRGATEEVAARSRASGRLRRQWHAIRGQPVALAYESEGVQAQLSPEPARRQALRAVLLPLGTERAKLQALLSGWPRRQSYDSSIAIALQLALDGRDSTDGRDNALQMLRDSRAAILNEREIAGKAQYFRCTLLLGLAIMLLLVITQHNLFKELANFWLGAQAGLLGSVMSIALALRRRTVALDICVGGNISDSALRLIIGALSGGTLVLVFATGLLPSLHTLQGEQTGSVGSLAFVLLLGIIGGFVEQLVPSLLEDQAQRFRNADDAKPTDTRKAAG